MTICCVLKLQLHICCDPNLCQCIVSIHQRCAQYFIKMVCKQRRLFRRGQHTLQFLEVALFIVNIQRHLVLGEEVRDMLEPCKRQKKSLINMALLLLGRNLLWPISGGPPYWIHIKHCHLLLTSDFL